MPFKLRAIALPVIVYAAAALFITWPLALHLDTHLAGPEYADSIEYVRLGWWSQYALAHGLNPFYQSLFGYPDGFFSATQWAQPLIYWPIALLSIAVKPIAASNLWLLIEIVLNGVAAYWLCLEIVGASKRPAALVGGLVFMAFPAAQGHILVGHINPLANYALPIVALCLQRILADRRAIRSALLGAAAILILLLGNYTAGVYGLLPLVLFGGLYALRCRRMELRHALRPFALMFGLGALLLIPFYLPLAIESLSANRPAYLNEGGAIQYSTEVLAFAAPSPFTAWLRPIVPDFARTVIGTNIIEGFAYIGIVTALLALLALRRRWLAARPWGLLAVGCMIFSLGPVFKWLGQPVQYNLDHLTITVPLPWLAFQSLPLINATRTPGRFNITTGLAFGVLVALGLTEIVGSTRWRGWAISLLAVALILGEYQVMTPYPITPASVAPYFATLADRPDIRAVFDIPWDDGGAQKGALAEQIDHHHALLAGYVTRRTTVAPARLAALSKIAIGEGLDIQALSPSLDADAVRSILKQNGVDVLVYHWRTLDRNRVLPWAIQTFGAPAYQDDTQAIFEIPAASQPFTDAVVVFGDGWWADDTLHWTKGDSTLLIYTPQASDRQWRVTLTPLLVKRNVQFYLDGKLISGTGLASTGQEVDLWLRLDPGFHTLRLVFPAGCAPTPVPPVCVLFNVPNRSLNGCNALPAPICVSAALNRLVAEDAGAMALQERLVHLHGVDDVSLDLRGFRIPTIVKVGEPFSVVTDWLWQSQQVIRDDYHLFVHLLSKTGVLAAQADKTPGGGSFPTTQWHTPQQWSESLPLATAADLPPGVYGIYVGWYRYPELDRLHVDGNSPGAQDGLVYLGNIELRTTF